MCLNTPKGVMNEDYSRDRKKKNHLSFKSRAYETARSFKNSRLIKTQHFRFRLCRWLCITETHKLLDANLSLGVEYLKI